MPSLLEYQFCNFIYFHEELRISNLCHLLVHCGVMARLSQLFIAALQHQHSQEEEAVLLSGKEIQPLSG